MQNMGLAKDHVIRAEKRLSALKALYKEQAWADVVRESQEVVELALKGLLRACNIEVPRVHDVSDIMIREKALMPAPLRSELSKLAKISKNLRRDRELAFYGSEDLTPKDFYKEDDAKIAMDQATYTVKAVKPHVV
jgi:HEPN domain-containing protein